MSTMSALHAEIAKIAQHDAQLVRSFHNDQASHRWGMLTAAEVIMTAAPSLTGEALEALLFAHRSIMAAHEMAQPEG